MKPLYVVLCLVGFTVAMLLWADFSKPYAIIAANWMTATFGLYPTIVLIAGASALGIWSNMRD